MPQSNQPKKIYESNNTVIYKGKYKNYDDEVIIKLVKSKYATEAQLEKIKNEYNLINNFKIKGIRKALAIDKFESSNALVLQFVEGDALKSFIQKNININRFLKIAINLSQTLGELHTKYIIHRDINCNNI